MPETVDLEELFRRLSVIAGRPTIGDSLRQWWPILVFLGVQLVGLTIWGTRLQSDLSYIRADLGKLTMTITDRVQRLDDRMDKLRLDFEEHRRTQHEITKSAIDELRRRTP